MATLEDLVVSLSVNTAALRSGLNDATTQLKTFGEKVSSIDESIRGFGEAAVGLEAVKMGMEAIAKAGEFMEQGIKDAAALGNAPARELGETLEHVGLATRQLGADLMSDLAPAFNALIEYFVGGVDWGKLLSNVAAVLGQAFRMLVEPIVAVAGALKGLIEGGDLASALKGAADATAALAKHGADFAGSLKTAGQQARIIANMQLANTDKNIDRQVSVMDTQFSNLSGNRRNDRFAGAMAGFSDFNDALNRFTIDMKAAADLTRLAADAESYGSKIQAEAYRLQADQYTQAADKAKQAADGFRQMKEKLIQDTQAINNIHFTLGESLKNIGVNAGIRTQQYNRTFDPTAGFKDFGDALAKQTQALENEAGLKAAAEIIDKQFGAAAQGTVLALKAQADQEGRSAQAAGAAADAFFAVKDKIRDQLLGALNTAFDSFTSKIGKLGEAIKAGIQGFQSGGIWGALIAVVMDLVSQVKDWSRIVDIANGQFSEMLNVMGPGLDALISGIRQMMGGLGSFSQVIGGILTPILKLLAPILTAIGTSFQFLGVVLSPLIDIVTAVADILGSVLKPVLQAVSWLFTGLAEAILGVKLGFEEAARGIVWVIVQIFDAFNNHSLDNTLSGLDQTIADTKQQMTDLWAHGLAGLQDQSADTAEAMGAAAAATTANAAAISKFSEQLTNLPTGYKLAAATFGAMQAVGTGPRIPGTSSVIHIENLEVKAASMTDLYSQLLRLHERQKFNGGGGG